MGLTVTVNHYTRGNSSSARVLQISIQMCSGQHKIYQKVSIEQSYLN